MALIGAQEAQKPLVVALRHIERADQHVVVAARMGQPHALEETPPGPGCAHNLLGTGARAAAMAVKEWLAGGHAGTLRYYPLDWLPYERVAPLMSASTWWAT